MSKQREPEAPHGFRRHVSVARVDRYGHDLFSFDSKFITEPGNRLAIEYLATIVF